MKYVDYVKKDACEVCGRISRYLLVHHKDESRKLGNKNINNNPDNLMTLCHMCHGTKHSKLRGTYQAKVHKLKIDAKINSWIEKESKKLGIPKKSFLRIRLLELVNKSKL